MKAQTLNLALLFAIIGMLAFTVSASLFFGQALVNLCDCPLEQPRQHPKPKDDDRLQKGLPI